MQLSSRQPCRHLLHQSLREQSSHPQAGCGSLHDASAAVVLPSAAEQQGIRMYDGNDNNKNNNDRFMSFSIADRLLIFA